MELFEIRNLSFTYPNQEEQAIHNLSIKIEKGDFLVLCGPSGSGKSTLLRQLKTVLAPHGVRRGEILFEGTLLDTIDRKTQAAEIGFVGQSPENQIVTDKVWHEMAFGLESLGFDTPTIRGRVAEMAAFLGIEDWFYKNVSELSGGQKQLLNLASVMVLQPSVLILDEPTSQLDPIAASEFLAILGKINREIGTTVILTEHRLEEAFPLATEIAVMESGRLICKGTAREIGKELRGQGNRMFLAMPTPMRIWAATENELECPVTVAQGRQWLHDFSRQHPLKEVPQREVPVTNKELAIHAKDLWYRYEKDLSDTVKGLSLNVRKGEFFALMGGNGTGKTTTLRLLSGLSKPYRGELSVKGRPALLPQNPQTLFVCKTVRQDLLEPGTFAYVPENKDEDEQVARVVSLCRLGHLLDRHPYDLSGGEQQRLALAKILLTKPDLLLLDEPTKGFDAEFKQVFAAILHNLLAQGITVFMVSHDIEFCAKYAHTCALLFDGSIVTSGTPSSFFSGNSFYTTAANRMARNQIQHAVTAEDVITACGGTVPEERIAPCPVVPLPEPKVETPDWKPEKLPLWRRTIAILSGISAFAVFLYAAGQTDLSKMVDDGGLTGFGMEQVIWYVVMIFSLFLCALASYKKSPALGYAHIPSSLSGKESHMPPNNENVEKTSPLFVHAFHKERRKLTKRTLAAILLILLCIPFTLYIGITCFEQKQYYVTALLVLLESMLPFFLVFEGRKPKARELVVIAVLCAIGIAGRTAFFMLPQFKPVAAITIIAGIAFGGETGFMVGALTMLVSNVLLSQGPWTPWQMFCMGMIGFLAGILFRQGFLRRTRIMMCIYGMLSVLILYGGIMNPVSALLWGGKTLNVKIILSYYVTGFPMDCIHSIATFLFLWFGAEPMLEKLDRIKVKYGMIATD